MSYWLETEKEEVEQYGTDFYAIVCPYCNNEIEFRDVSQMPWGEDTEEEFICPSCNKHFEIRPKYKFLGFYIYTDDEQEECENEQND